MGTSKDAQWRLFGGMVDGCGSISAAASEADTGRTITRGTMMMDGVTNNFK